MNLNIGVIKGDGIGPEIVTEAMKVLDKVGRVFTDIHAITTQLLMGGASIDVTRSTAYEMRQLHKQKQVMQC